MPTQPLLPVCLSHLLSQCRRSHHQTAKRRSIPLLHGNATAKQLPPTPTCFRPAARRPLALGLEQDVVCQIDHVQLAVVVAFQRLNTLRSVRSSGGAMCVKRVHAARRAGTSSRMPGLLVH